MSSILRYKIETVEIDIGATTYKFISQNLPIQILNEYYGYKPLIKNVADIAAEIREKDTVTRRLKVTLLDTLTFAPSSTDMASFWLMWIASNKNYKGKLIRYSRRLGDGDLELRFVGKIDNITIANNGNVTIEAIDLLKAMSNIKYPFLSGIRLAEDIPAVFNISTVQEYLNLSDAVTGDYAKQTARGMDWISAGPEVGGVAFAEGNHYMFVVAVNSVGEAVDATPYIVEIVVPPGGASALTIEWDDSHFNATSFYNVYYGTTEALGTLATIQAPPDTTFTWDGTGGVASETPTEIYRYVQLTGDDYSDPADWTEVDPSPEPFTIDIDGDIALLEDEGYLKLDEEIIYYDHIATDSEGYSLTGILRGQFGTESPRHSQDTAFYFILAVQVATDIFLQMKAILILAGIDEIYINAQFDTYALEGILDVTCLPIIEEQKLSDIYFDLVNLADCMSWQDEDGTITIKKHTEESAEYKLITDEANLIYNSISIDLNEESRLTRWVLLWNRSQLDKKLDDDDAYERGNITIDGDAETFYENSETDKQHSAWLNAGTEAEITAANTYANNILLRRLYRTNEAQPILSASLEIKDDTIKLADIVKIKTSKVLNENGVKEFLKYRAIKKEPSGNKIKFQFKRHNGLFVTPETILEIYGENWNGSVMSGHIGPSVTENGTVASVTSGGPNGKHWMSVGTVGSYLELDALLNADTDNYVVFTVTQILSASFVVSNALDFRKDDNTSYNLVIPSSIGSDVTYGGWRYGTASLNTVSEAIVGEDVSNWQIRCWVFQQSAGKFYLSGGTEKITGGWEPTPLGDTGYIRRILTTPGNDPDPAMAHCSIHKFNAIALVDLNWLNDYGNALAAFYALTWNNITE